MFTKLKIGDTIQFSCENGRNKYQIIEIIYSMSARRGIRYTAMLRDFSSNYNYYRTFYSDDVIIINHGFKTGQKIQLTDSLIAHRGLGHTRRIFGTGEILTIRSVDDNYIYFTNQKGIVAYCHASIIHSKLLAHTQTKAVEITENEVNLFIY